MPYAAVNGIEIYYESHGAGYPILFCHEFAGDYRSWDLQVGFFSRTYNVITYCARGYPPSSVPESQIDYSQEQAVADLKGLMTKLGIEKAHIIGLSMGGNVALNFGLNHPEMAYSLVVAGTGTGSDEPEPFRSRVIEMADGMLEEGMDYMSDYLDGPARVQLRQKDPKGYELFKSQFLGHSSIGSANTFRGVLSRRPSVFELAHKLRALYVPTLVLTGDEDDPCINPALFMKENIPAAGLSVFPRSGHAINLEEPGLFNRTVMDFFVQVEANKWGPRHLGESSGSLA